MFSFFVSTYLKIFLLLTPFFLLSMFLGMTRQMDDTQRRRVGNRTVCAILVIVTALFFFGNPILNVLGISMASLQIGAGALLFLSAVALVHGTKIPQPHEGEDISVVPLALPMTVGPGTIGTVLVWGTQLTGTPKLVAFVALVLAVLTIGALLHAALTIERLMGEKGLSVLMKLTGLVLAALSSQLIFTGIHKIWNYLQGAG